MSESQIYLNFHSECEQVQSHKVRLKLVQTSESQIYLNFHSECEQVQSHKVRLKVKAEGCIKPRVRQSQQQLVAGSTAVVCAPRNAISWLCQS